MLDNIYISFVFFRLGIRAKGYSFTVKLLHERYPLLFLCYWRGVKVYFIEIIAFCLGYCLLDLKLCYRICKGKDFFEVQNISAKNGISELFDKLQEIYLIVKLSLKNIVFQCSDDANCNKNGCYFLFRYYKIPYSFRKIQWEIVKVKCDEPLEQPKFIRYVYSL